MILLWYHGSDKKEHTLMKEDNFALPILTGQLFIYCLKCREDELRLLYPRLQKHIMEETGGNVETVLDDAFKAFLDKFKARYSLESVVADILHQKFIALFRQLSAKNNYSEELATLKITDAWAGLSGALRMNPVPCSLLDYFIEMVLPFFVTKEELASCQAHIDNVFKNDDDPLASIDNILGQIANRFCFQTALSANNEVKLAILLHLPQTNSALGVKTGIVFQMLKLSYTKEDV